MVFKFTIDDLVNRFIPYNRVERLPKPIARFLGKHKVKPVADYWIWLEILIATFCGIACLEGIFKSDTVFKHHHAPMIIASYGASAILCFNAISAPLSQPRNVLMGHFLSSIIGVGIQKLFGLSQRGRDNYWAAGALSVAVSSVVMAITNCVHPPAGASSLIPSVDAEVREMGWWYLPMQLISSVIMLAIACITGNIIRSYPTHWWTAAPLKRIEPESEKVEMPDEESRLSKSEGFFEVANGTEIMISGNEVKVPAELDLDELEKEWLNTLKDKMHQLQLQRKANSNN